MKVKQWKKRFQRQIRGAIMDIERIYLTGGEAEIDSRGWKIRPRNKKENGEEYREENGARSREKRKKEKNVVRIKGKTEVERNQALNTDLIKDEQINHSRFIATWLTWPTYKNTTFSVIMHFSWADLFVFFSSLLTSIHLSWRFSENVSWIHTFADEITDAASASDHFG